MLKRKFSKLTLISILIFALVSLPSIGISGADPGQQITTAGIRSYVNTDGTCSVVVGENDERDGILWLPVFCENIKMWLALENFTDEKGNAFFADGTVFSARFFNQTDDPAEFDRLYKESDCATVRSHDQKELTVCQITITAPDGSAYGVFPQTVKLYFQLADNWDRADLEAALHDGAEEPFPVNFDTVNSPEGKGEFGIAAIKHEPGAIFFAEESQFPASVFADHPSAIIGVACGLIILIGVIAVICKKRKKDAAEKNKAAK